MNFLLNQKSGFTKAIVSSMIPKRLTSKKILLNSSNNGRGQDLKAYGKVYYNRFIVLMVDETAHGASGCSIDSSVHFLKDLQQKYEVNLFDRLNMAYRDSSNEIATADRSAFGKLVNMGEINDNTIVFNNLVRNKAEFETKWEVPMVESWHKRIF